MGKRFHIVLLTAALLLVFAEVAAASVLIPAADEAKGRAPAPDRSPAISGEWGLERVDFIHYAKPAGGTGAARTDSCYKLLGPSWKTGPVSYVVNPANSQGLTEEFVTSSISASAETWDASTSRELFSDTYTVDYGAVYGIRDYRNSVVFGSYADSNVIGVTSVWYTRQNRQMVEFDMLFNTAWAWGDATVNPAAMDLLNIGVHEMGHAAGLGDIYSTSCPAVTMYGYSGNGETSKRSLEAPDITGLQKLYGP